MRLVAFVGFKGSGKNTAALALQQQGFHTLSFADAIKDALAAVFCWPRDLLEGDTDESRMWRETIDHWWAEKLGLPSFTPRRAMQLVGTDAMRHHFHQQVWTLNVERRINMLPPDTDVALIDGRFPNEIAMVRRLGGCVWRVGRGPEPVWRDIALRALAGIPDARYGIDRLGVHLSEYAWLAETVDGVLDNNTDVASLHAQVIDKVLPTLTMKS